MAAAGPRGLEAMLLRPSGTRTLSAGADQPRRAARRRRRGRRCRPIGSYRQALEFARRGFAALVVMRRGYGDSGGPYAESNGPLRPAAIICGRHRRRRAICAPRSRPCATGTDVSTERHDRGRRLRRRLRAASRWPPIAPPGLAAAINFAGGRGSRADNDVCDEDALVRAFATLGRTSRIPMLWIYAAERQVLSGPNWRAGCTRPSPAPAAAPNSSTSPPFGDDGHSLFSRGHIALDADGRSLPARAKSRNARSCRGAGAVAAAAAAATCAKKDARHLPTILPRARTRPLRSRRRALSLSAPDGARPSKRRRQPSPAARNTPPIARSMRSMTISRTASAGCALNAVERQACRSGVDDHEAVEFVGDLDLARQPRIRPHVEAEIQHVLFHRRRRADLLAPGFIDIDVAGRAGAGAAAFGLDAGNGVADRGFHHGRAVLDFNGSCFAGMVDKVDLGHDRSCCRNR